MEERKIQTLRKKAGLSQSQLAERAGINFRVLQKYEQGSNDFDHARLDTILKVCIALDCRIEDILENPEYIALLTEYKKKEGSRTSSFQNMETVV